MKVSYCAWMIVLALAVGTGASFAAPAQESATTVVPTPQGQREQDERRQGQRRQPWWRDAANRAELGITDQQSAKIESIWQSVAQAQRDRWREQQKLEPIVEKLLKEGTADPVQVAAQVERLETLKAELLSTRIMMLYRMKQELSPSQREKLTQLLDRREAERRKSTDSHDRRF